MFNLKSMLSCPCGYHDYRWVDVLLVHETRKAILIEFDDRKAWLPKAWVVAFRRSKTGKQPQLPKTITIKISLYNWSKKFF